MVGLVSASLNMEIFFACTGTGVNSMRTFRNHTIVNAAFAGNSIRVVGQAMRSLPVYLVCLLGKQARLEQPGQTLPTNCAGKRCATSPRSVISDRPFGQERTWDMSPVSDGLALAG
jgi:hypothetical protein